MFRPHSLKASFISSFVYSSLSPLLLTHVPFHSAFSHFTSPYVRTPYSALIHTTMLLSLITFYLILPPQTFFFNTSTLFCALFIYGPCHAHSAIVTTLPSYIPNFSVTGSDLSFFTLLTSRWSLTPSVNHDFPFLGFLNSHIHYQGSRILQNLFIQTHTQTNLSFPCLIISLNFIHIISSTFSNHCLRYSDFSFCSFLLKSCHQDTATDSPFMHPHIQPTPFSQTLAFISIAIPTIKRLNCQGDITHPYIRPSFI